MKSFTLIPLLFLLPITVLAQNNPYFVSATENGAAQEVEVYDNYLFVGNGSTLTIYDISDNSQPPYTVLKDYRYKSRVQDLKIYDNYLYVAANHDGISKWDLSATPLPELLYRIEPGNMEEAAYDIEICGDTVIVASKNKVILYFDTGNKFEKLSEIGNTGEGVICGGALYGNLYAYVKGLGNFFTRGVYIYDLNSLQRLSFYRQSFGDPEDLIFGNGGKTLHVFGGTQSTNNPFSGNGYFYSLDVSVPESPVLIFSDTIPGITAISIANAINGICCNDTVFVATGGGTNGNFLDGDSCYLYVYDATSPYEMHFLNRIYAGLWHFDVCKKNKTLFVASEWYGVKTVDISDFFNPADMGNTFTGGWNTGSDICANRLCTANEGGGLFLYDISDLQNPVKLNSTDRGTFCHTVRFSNDGQYIYAFYSTDTGFYVYSVPNLATIGFIKNNVGEKKAFVSGDILVSQQSTLTQGKYVIYFISVENPSSPFVIDSISLFVNDFFVCSGKMFASSDKKISVYDIREGVPVLVEEYLLDQNDIAGAITVSQDTVFCHISKTDTNYIALLTFDSVSNNLIFNGYFPTGINDSKPKTIASDNNFLYLGYNLYGLRKYDKTTLNYLSFYKTGLDYKNYENKFGLTELQCKRNLIVLSEYFAQTSLLVNDTAILPVPYYENRTNKTITVFPNPASDILFIKMQPGEKMQIEYQIYDSRGKKVLKGAGDRINIKNLKQGVYFIAVNTGNFLTGVKFIKYNRLNNFY